MVRRTSRRKHRVVKRGRAGYKKCVLGVMRRTKFKTAKQARKAFGKASKKCRAKVLKKAPKRKGRKPAKKHARKCKYGHRKGSKRCRKTPR